MLCAECTRELPERVEKCPHCGASPLLRGRYALEGIVGRGALGVTYRARRADDDRIVAIKELPLRALDNLKTLELFEREARVLRQLDHPSIPRHIEDFEAGVGRNAAFYVVQDFVRGRTLAEELAQHRYTEREVLQILEQLLDVLAYLHSRTPPVIHRDIKAGNVMRREVATEDDRAPAGSLVLIDFGAVRDVARDPSAGGSTVAGTFGYMAPEQFRGHAEPASDLYALGVLAVVLLSGERPEKMLDPLNRFDWQSHVKHAHVGVINLLKTLLEPELEKRARDAEKVRRHVGRVLELVDQTRSARAGAAGSEGATELEINRPTAKTGGGIEPHVVERLLRASEREAAEGRRARWVKYALLVVLLAAFFGAMAPAYGPAFAQILDHVRWSKTHDGDPSRVMSVRANLESAVKDIRQSIDRCVQVFAIPPGSVLDTSFGISSVGRGVDPRVSGAEQARDATGAISCIESSIRAALLPASSVRQVRFARMKLRVGDDGRVQVIDSPELRFRVVRLEALSSSPPYIASYSLRAQQDRIAQCLQRRITGEMALPASIRYVVTGQQHLATVENEPPEGGFQEMIHDPLSPLRCVAMVMTSAQLSAGHSLRVALKVEELAD